MITEDLHNHTIFSYDGENTAEEIIKNAISKEIKIIGICDHQFSIGEKLLSYTNEINSLKEKYKNQITVLAGLEIGLRPKPYNLVKINDSGLDYCLFESLDSDRFDTMDIYEFFEWTRLFKMTKGLAHTDIFKLRDKFGIDIFEKLKEYDLFWEINTSGNYTYYYDFLTNHQKQQEIKKSKISVSIGSDTHNLRNFNVSKLKSAHSIIEKLGNPIIFS